MNLKHLFFLAVAGTLAVACSEVNENSLTDGDGQRMLRTISSGNDRFTTRLNSETSEWENDDAIGIYMFDTEDKNVLNDALNVKYTTIGEGLTANFSSDPGIAIYDMPTNFVAYYPHTTSADVIDATAALYKVDVSDQSNGISAHDLMWAKAANQSTESLLAGGLAFTFHHKLVLLRVKITNENVSNVTSITVGGMNTTATFSLIDGKLTNMDTQKSISLQKTGDKSFIVLVVNALFEYLAYFAYRHLFAVFGCVAVVEEELQRVDAVVGLYILAVAHTGDGRDVQPGAFGNIFQNHGAEQ